MSAWAAFGILAAATAVSGAIAGSSIGESGMLYRGGHAYDLPENPLVRAKRHSSGASEQYVARTMIVDGRQVGFDPYALEDYEPLEEYAAVEPVHYLPIEDYSSAPGVQMAAAGDTARQVRQVAERVERMTAKIAASPQVTIMRGTERSIAPIGTAAARPAKANETALRVQAANIDGPSTQDSIVVTDG